MRVGWILGGLCSLSILVGGTAWAQGPRQSHSVGWYQVEGEKRVDVREPGPKPAPSEVSQASKGPAAQSPAPEEAQPPPEAPTEGEAGPRKTARHAPSCLAKRGALVRRLLELHGLEVSRIEISDEALGLLGARSSHHAELIVPSPDTRLLSGAAPIPPGSVAFDSDAKQLWEDWLACALHHALRARAATPGPRKPVGSG